MQLVRVLCPIERDDEKKVPRLIDSDSEDEGVKGGNGESGSRDGEESENER